MSIEAGGNAPFIVFDDADIPAAVEGMCDASVCSELAFLTLRTGAIACKFRGTGQTCICANRIFVQSGVYADFASRLAEKVAQFKVGDGLDPKTQVSLRSLHFPKLNEQRISGHMVP